MPTPRTILHLDLDAFFCSVEELLDPSLVGTAFAVGAPAAERGVLSTASYAARQYGIHSAMPTAQALRLCPHLRLIGGRHRLYSDYSRRVMALLANEAPVVEQISIDEAFLDVTGDPRTGGGLASLLQARIKKEAGLPSSFGVASSKLVAKIATNVGKPNGLVVVPPGEEAGFLAPLPMSMLWGVGPKARARFSELGVKTIGDIAACAESDLVRWFGSWGVDLHRHSRGIDNRPVESEHEAKSISQETTFARDVSEGADLRRTLLDLSEQVGASLRRSGLAARTVRLKLRWPPFETITRQTTLPDATQLDEVIYSTAVGLFEKEWKPGKPVRLIGVGVSGLGEPAKQLGLFDSAADLRSRRLAETMDKIRAKYGWNAVKRAAFLGEDE